MVIKKIIRIGRKIFRIFIPMKPKITLLTWMAVNNDPDALKSLIKHLEKKYEIGRILYLYQKELAKKLNEVKPLSSVLMPIEVAVKNPTVHKDIYSTIKGLIIPQLANIKNLVINVSSGTPAMHAVWLILYAAGEFPVGTRLISSQKNRTTGKTSCDNVDFPISTYLSELRKYEKENPDEGSYNPEAKSEARRRALERIRVYSRAQGVPLLLLGERGIGKSHLVESFIAPIKEKKVVTLACGSLDSTLAESTIFGHKKGAFTGANEDRRGLLKEADGKILFLDEIQDLPKSIQRKLVRTLQDKEHRYRSLGKDKEETANVEIVCASNLSEDELRKRLDPDFYDRISFFTVELPPLRRCREDLLEDWAKTWKTTRLESSPEQVPMDRALKNFLMTSSLSGNFRNLQSLAYQIIAWNGKKTITEILQDISFEDEKINNNDVIKISINEKLSWKEATKQFQSKLAEYACHKYKSQIEASNALDCTTKTLQNALKEK